ncbi:MAG: hypothetical protein NC355_04280 [Blautia sp.]|nr:hypothetical protein [Blautia sp.]
MSVIRHVFQDFVIVDNRIWFSNNTMNGLFSANPESGQTELVRIFPGEKLFQCRLYTKVYVYNNRLVFIPYCAENISVYNILNDSFIQIETPISKKERMWSSFITVQWENKIFLFNDHMQDMAVLDVNDCIIRMCPIPMRNKISVFLEMPIRCVVDDCAYIVQDNLLITVKMSSNQVFVREIAEAGVRFAGIQYGRDRFWIIDCENKLYAYRDEDNMAEKKLERMQADWNKSPSTVKDFFLNGQNIWVLLDRQNYLIHLNIFTMESDIILYENGDRLRNSILEYSCYDSQKQRIQILRRGEARHRILDLDKGKWSTIIYETPWEEIKEVYQENLKQCDYFMIESLICEGLDTIRLFTDIQEATKDLNNEKSCGKEIFQYLA